MSDTDWIASERDHEYRMEQEKTKQVRAKAEARATIWQYVLVTFGIVAGIGILVGAVAWGLESSAKRGSAERLACVQSGGTVVETTSGQLCLRLADGGTDG